MKITICGDLSVTGYTYDAFYNKDVNAAFGDSVELYKTSDYVLINLECALTERSDAIKKIGPNLKGPENTADTLKTAGFTHCLLSNNHIFDFDRGGIKDTLEALDRVGLEYTGFGNNYEDSKKDLILEKDGVRVAVINVCEHEYTYATENRMGARPFDEFETMDDIRRARSSADHVIVIYHGGKEHCRYPSPRLMKACHEMVRCGADFVACQHSHIIGCYEEFEGGHILYGQGNFHFTKYFDKDSWNEGLVAILDIDKQGIKVQYRAVKCNKNSNGIRLADETETKEILDGVYARNAELVNGKWRDGWHSFCSSVEHVYRSVMVGAHCPDRHYKIDDDADTTQMFAHYLDCEAHTDVWRELFKTWNHTN